MFCSIAGTELTENWIIEGLADYVRHTLGYPSKSSELPKYDAKRLFKGYQYTAHFFLWLREKYGELEIKEIARRISEGKTFDLEKLKSRLKEYELEQNRRDRY